MSIAGPIALLGAAALIAFVLRKRLDAVGPVAVVALVTAIAIVAATPTDAHAEVLDLVLRLTPLVRLAGLVILSTLLLLVVFVWADEPAYNYFPTALAVGGAALAALVLIDPLAIYATLLFALLVPVGSFTFQVHRNRSAEAALRHFGFVTLGGCLGLAALALAAGLPREQSATTFVLLMVILCVAFALQLAVIPFHTHATLLAGEAPTSALALYFGVLAPATFIAFVEILTLSGVLPAITQIGKVQDLLLGIGLVSALGGALLASGAPDLRRLVVYAVISNVGAALVGMATLSGPGIVGALVIVLTTGACAAQQLVAVGALERRASPDRPRASHAPLAAAAFVAGGVGMIGAPPLVGFPGHFFVELIGFSFATWIGAALVVSTLVLVVAQLRAGISLFSGSTEGLRLERRPVAGAIGVLIFFALLVGGIQPDAILRPIADFADEFLKALRPL